MDGFGLGSINMLHQLIVLYIHSYIVIFCVNLILIFI